MKSNIDITGNAQWLWTNYCDDTNLDFGIITAKAYVIPSGDQYIARCSITLMPDYPVGYVTDGENYEKSIEPIELASSGKMLFETRVEAEQECRKWFNEHVVLAMVKALSFILEQKDFKLFLNARDLEKLAKED